MTALFALVPRQLWIALAAAGLLAAFGWACFFAGGKAADARWAASQADTAAAANRKLLQAIDQGIAASTNLQAALQAQAASYAALKGPASEARQSKTLIVYRYLDRGAAGATVPAAQPVANAPRDPAELSRAALWMWNSALAGRDVHADSCGLADQSDSACAAASGVPVADALANHELNAQSCAVDRLRLQSLLALLHKRQGLPSPTTATTP